MKGQLTTEQRLKQVNSRLINENSKLRQENTELKQRLTYLEEQLEKALLYIEELQAIVFKKKKKKNDDQDNGNNLNGDNSNSAKQSKKRDSSSYRRPTPPVEEITDQEESHIDCCPHCHSELTKIKIIERYIEDILPLVEWYKTLKKVTKRLITTGYCPCCQKRVSAEPIPKQTVTLGENIKQLVTFANVIQQLSYRQLSDFLEGVLHFKLSKGEIINILEEQSFQLRPESERMRANIRGQPGAHFDETTWKVQKGEYGNYAWVMTGVKDLDTIFLLGRNRGQGNIVELQGEDNYGQIGISDDYAAYKNIFEKHALCWSHPHRKLRDLKNSDYLSPKKRKQCGLAYEKFAQLYSQVKETATKPFSLEERTNVKKQLMIDFEKITVPHPDDPIKLRKIKERLLEQQECYFTCITEPNIPPDNNKAERALRHLVLKRKKSFGSKTQKGADMMSILYSVILSLWWKSKETFFQEYSAALQSA